MFVITTLLNQWDPIAANTHSIDKHHPFAMLRSISYVLTSLIPTMLLSPNRFQLYFPDDVSPQQLDIPYKKLKGYLQTLGEDYQVALVDLPTASRPYFPSVGSIPDELFITYQIVVRAAHFLNFLSLMSHHRNYSWRNLPCYKFVIHLKNLLRTSLNQNNGTSSCHQS